MGTRSVISAPQSKPSCNSRTRFGHVEVKKEFRIISESPEDEIKVRINNGIKWKFWKRSYRIHCNLVFCQKNQKIFLKNKMPSLGRFVTFTAVTKTVFSKKLNIKKYG